MDQISQLRTLIAQARDEMRSPGTAAYFAEKLLTLSDDLDDVLLCAQAYRENGESRRAHDVLCGIPDSLRVMLTTPKMLHVLCLALMDYGMTYETLKHLEWYHRVKRLGEGVDLHEDPSALRTQLERIPNVVYPEAVLDFSKRNIVKRNKSNQNKQNEPKPNQSKNIFFLSSNVCIPCHISSLFCL